MERQVPTLRKQVFELMLSFESWQDFNAFLLQQCQDRILMAPYPDDKTTTVAIRFAEEQRILTPCNLYQGCRVEWVRVNSLALVGFDAHKYSVPCQYALRNIELHISASEIKVIAEGQELARHPRSFDKQ